MFELFMPLAFMLSPGALKAAGNGSGAGGMLFGIFLFAAMAQALFTGNGMGATQEGSSASRGLHCAGLGIISAARILVLFTLGTLWMGEAGYAFNELFAPWYPNLGFSFTLLALIFCISMLPETPRGVVLYLATMVTLAGVGYVAVMATQPHGLESWFPTMFPQKTPPFFPTGGDPVRSLYLALLALLGFDLAVRPDSGRGARRTAIAVLLAVAVFGVCMWGGLSAAHPLDLAGSVVPHFLMASIALGERGRDIMGVVVITGTFAAATALLTACCRQMQHLFRRPDDLNFHRAMSILLCLGVAAMLATGWAGEPRLEILIAVALTGWFAGYALINLSHAVRGVLPPLAVTGVLLYGFAACVASGLTTDIFAGLAAVLTGGTADAVHEGTTDSGQLLLFAYAFAGLCAAALLFALAFRRPPAQAQEGDSAPKGGQATKK